MGTTSIGRVRAVYSGLTGLPGVSTFYFDATTVDAADCVAFVAGFYDDIHTALNDNMTVTVQGLVDVLDPTTGTVTGVGTGSDQVIVGNETSAAIPAASQALLRIHTGQFVGGREIRGRIFIPGCTVADSTDGTPSSALRTSIESAAANMQDVANANGTWVVWSRVHAQWQVVNGWSVWTKYAVLRSRRD